MTTVASPAIEAGAVTVVPVCRTVVLRLGPAVFFWARPKEIRVVRGGPAERVPIIDMTRSVQAALFAIAAVCGGFLAFRAWGKEKTS